MISFAPEETPADAASGTLPPFVATLGPNPTIFAVMTDILQTMSNQIPTDREGSITRVTHLPYFGGGAGETGSTTLGGDQ
jgi:hypothetical protein